MRDRGCAVRERFITAPVAAYARVTPLRTMSLTRAAAIDARRSTLPQLSQSGLRQANGAQHGLHTTARAPAASPSPDEAPRCLPPSRVALLLMSRAACDSCASLAVARPENQSITKSRTRAHAQRQAIMSHIIPTVPQRRQRGTLRSDAAAPSRPPADPPICMYSSIFSAVVPAGSSSVKKNTNTKYTCDTGQTRNKLLEQWVRNRGTLAPWCATHCPPPLPPPCRCQCRGPHRTSRPTLPAMSPLRSGSVRVGNPRVT